MRETDESDGSAGTGDERRAFPYEPASVPAVRQFLRERLDDLGRDICDVVCVMASELATNAIRHGETGFELRLIRVQDVVRVEVTDTGRGLPTTRDPLVTEPSGRGLRLVAAMSDRWGVLRADSGPGKTVWFEVAAESPAPGSARPASRSRRDGPDEHPHHRAHARCGDERRHRGLAWAPWPFRASYASGNSSAVSRRG